MSWLGHAQKATRLATDWQCDASAAGKRRKLGRIAVNKYGCAHAGPKATSALVLMLVVGQQVHDDSNESVTDAVPELGKLCAARIYAHVSVDGKTVTQLRVDELNSGGLRRACRREGKNDPGHSSPGVTQQLVGSLLQQIPQLSSARVTASEVQAHCALHGLTVSDSTAAGVARHVTAGSATGQSPDRSDFSGSVAWCDFINRVFNAQLTRTFINDDLSYLGMAALQPHAMDLLRTCRPVLCVDATHMTGKGTYNTGCLLVVSVLTADGNVVQVYHLHIAHPEDLEAWVQGLGDFTRRAKPALAGTGGSDTVRRWCIASDGAAAIAAAVKLFCPDAHHQVCPPPAPRLMCSRHCHRHVG